MRYLILLLGIIACAPSNQPQSIPIPPVNSIYVDFPVDMKTIFNKENFIYQDQSIPFNGKRLYYIHGCLTCDHLTGLMNTPAYANLVYELNSQGWQIIEFDLPIYNRFYWHDNGKAYREAFSRKLEQSINWADKNYGKASVNIVGGISYGSLHSLMAPKLNKKFNGYFGVLCLEKIDSLYEFSGETADYFDPSESEEIKTLSKLPGFLVWNTTDDRAGFTNTVNLYNILISLNFNIQNYIYNEGGHSINNGNLDYIYSWLINNF